jgi:hypothetical protein
MLLMRVVRAKELMLARASLLHFVYPTTFATS